MESEFLRAIPGQYSGEHSIDRPSRSIWLMEAQTLSVRVTIEVLVNSGKLRVLGMKNLSKNFLLRKHSMRKS